MAEMPVWMKKSGFSLDAGFIGRPFMSRYFSGIIGGSESIGSPKPLKTLPKMSVETPARALTPVGTTPAVPASMPLVPCRT